MTRSWSINADDVTHRITIRGPDGQEHTFQGFFLCAGDGFEGADYQAAEGSAADAAFAFVQGYDKAALAPFYKSAALHFMRALGPEKIMDFSSEERVLEHVEKVETEH